jgi:HAD superfamily hydrolase (TIGR01509 family)
VIKAVAFDLIGVLLEVNDFQLTAFQTELAQAFGLIPADFDFINHFAGTSGKDVAEVERETRFVISHKYDIREPDFFSHLPKLKYAVASNHLSYMSDRLRILPIGRHFDLYFTSGDRGLAKPCTAYYYALAKELEEPPVNILFIDDTAANCEGAAATGMKAVHFTTNMNLSEVVLNNL